MPLDLKEILAVAFMNLCEKKPIKKIIVKDILEESHLSRKSFYNYFKDKNDLIQYCYNTRIIPQWYAEAVDDENLRRWNIEWLNNMRKHAKFMRSGVESDETNGLKNYMLTKDRDGDTKWFLKNIDGDIPDEVRLCVDYHAGACRYIIIEWIMAGMITEPEIIERMISFNRTAVLNLIKSVQAAEH